MVSAVLCPVHNVKTLERARNRGLGGEPGKRRCLLSPYLTDYSAGVEAVIFVLICQMAESGFKTELALVDGGCSTA